jgi:hypothetical protein
VAKRARPAAALGVGGRGGQASCELLVPTEKERGSKENWGVG